jgi:hypothetical protein
MADYLFEDFTIRVEWQQDGYAATVIGLSAEGVDPSGARLERVHPTEAAARVAAELFIKEKLAEIHQVRSWEYDDPQGAEE